MRQKEMELQERRAKGFLTKAETQAKYGWWICSICYIAKRIKHGTGAVYFWRWSLLLFVITSWFCETGMLMNYFPVSWCIDTSSFEILRNILCFLFLYCKISWFYFYVILLILFSVNWKWIYMKLLDGTSCYNFTNLT